MLVVLSPIALLISYYPVYLHNPVLDLFRRNPSRSLCFSFLLDSAFNFLHTHSFLRRAPQAFHVIELTSQSSAALFVFPHSTIQLHSSASATCKYAIPFFLHAILSVSPIVICFVQHQFPVCFTYHNYRNTIIPVLHTFTFPFGSRIALILLSSFITADADAGAVVLVTYIPFFPSVYLDFWKTQ